MSHAPHKCCGHHCPFHLEEAKRGAESFALNLPAGFLRRRLAPCAS
jgi:hypothetical protein